MRTIEISEEVWAVIAQRGKFGETEDDVLRRVFDIAPRAAVTAVGATRVAPAASPSANGHQRNSRPRQNVSTRRMSSFVQDRTLVVEFHGGQRKSFGLAERSDKVALRRVRDQAVNFARENGASYGQEMAVKKALTEAGYHLMR